MIIKTMESKFINIAEDNLNTEHLCCIIRSRTLNPGIEAKKAWLKPMLGNGHVFRKLDAKGTVFIEYDDLENAWVPIEGEGYVYVYCLWVLAPFKGKGYGKELMTYCIEDARSRGKSGICMLGSAKQKAWLSDQGFAKSLGLKTADVSKSGYEVLALSLDGSMPRFTAEAKAETIDDPGLVIYYDDQCPYIPQFLDPIKEYCKAEGLAAAFIHVQSLKDAKAVPGAFNNFAVFWKGTLQTVNLLDVNGIRKLISR